MCAACNREKPRVIIQDAYMCFDCELSYVKVRIDNLKSRLADPSIKIREEKEDLDDMIEFYNQKLKLKHYLDQQYSLKEI